MESFEYIGFKMKQIHDAFEADMNQILKEKELTMSQMGVFLYLFEHPDSIVTQKDIEQHLGLKHPTVVGILQRMESKGLIESVTDANDRRCKNILLTDKSYQLKEEIKKTKYHMDSNLVKGISKEEIDKLIELLDMMIQNIANMKHDK